MDATWYQLSTDEIFSKLQTAEAGLSAAEVEKRLQQYGKNTVPQPKSKTLATIFFSQFLDPLIYVLIAAAIISVFTGDVADAIFIVIIIVVNAILGAYQEWQAENSAEALRNMVKIKCRVKRNGRIYEVEAEELVPGDIVLLESGLKVPADLRLFKSNDLSVEEALLTGESLAVIKNIQPLPATQELSIGDRVNMAFAATTVQKGRGEGIVVATAQHTQIGLIANSLRVTEAEQPPLKKRMEAFSKKISFIVVGICVLLGVIGYLEGMPLHDIFFLMVAVGVSAIPEGLPVALTVALSIGTRRMAKRNVIVRKLPAVEGLGSCTLIASDKTGTLTMDQQSIQKIYLPDGKMLTVTGQGYNGEGQLKDGDTVITEPTEQLMQFLMASIFANEGILRKTANGWEHSGDAVDVAFRALAYKIGKEPTYFTSLAELVEMIPYESEKKYSGAIYRQNNQVQYVMKGAVETVLQYIPQEEHEQLNKIGEAMAADGYRVMAVAGAAVETADTENLPPLRLYGLIGMIDPLRAEAKEAVKACHVAGITVVMVTGDHPATALAIAKGLDIASSSSEIITGTELSAIENLPANELSQQLKNKKVFARVTPLQKQLIVETLKALGHFVAVTGDGANDAPALKSAHIGVAMGAGTDLAKEASSIIITDNNFASIEAGIEEGRFTYENLRKIIYLLISTGAAELLTVGLAIILNMPMPFIAVQLLWLNIVTNGIQDVSLAFEKGDPAVMLRPPRKPGENIFDKMMNSEVIISAIVMAGVVFGVWAYLLHQSDYNEVHSRSLIVMLMVLLQNFHVLNCRSETKSLLRIPFKNNYVLIGGIMLAQLVQIAAAYIPGLNTTLQLEPILLHEWLLLLPAALSIFVVMELFKWVWRSRMKSKTE